MTVELSKPSAPDAQLVVVLVEDSEFQAHVASQHLRTLGCEVTWVQTVAGAFDAITETNPDLIIVDLELVGETGWPLVERHRRAGDPKVVVLTSSRNGADARRALAAATVFISKDTRLSSMLKLVVDATPRRPREGR